MPAWATVVLTLGAAGIGAAAAIAGVILTNRHATNERQALEDSQRREAIGRVVGRVQNLLADLAPNRIAFNLNKHTSLDLIAARSRWLELREELAMIAATDGTVQVDRVANRLTSEVENLIAQLAWLVHAHLNGEGVDRDALDTATSHHDQAGEFAAELLAAVHNRLVRVG